MFTAIVAAQCFGGVWQDALRFVHGFGLVKENICKSRLTRRLHRLQPIVDDFIEGIGGLFADVRADKEFILDSTPIEACQNVRIPRCRLLRGKEFMGYKASFKTYFYGLKLQMLTTIEGIPVEYAITEGGRHDALGMRELPLRLGPESKVYADAAYTDYAFEDQMARQKAIEWLPQRKANSKRKRPKHVERQISKARKRIETAFSQIKDTFKRRIHAANIETFDDVREIQRHLKSNGIKLLSEADENTSGPASLMATDPDGNIILIDQHR